MSNIFLWVLYVMYIIESDYRVLSLHRFLPWLLCLQLVWSTASKTHQSHSKKGLNTYCSGERSNSGLFLLLWPKTCTAATPPILRFLQSLWSMCHSVFLCPSIMLKADRAAKCTICVISIIKIHWCIITDAVGVVSLWATGIFSSGRLSNRVRVKHI